MTGLKITYLRLDNSAAIFSGMSKRKIEIDFSKSKNKIVLLIGSNGTGKTTILRELHPFPHFGDRKTAFLEGDDGYKEIHYKKNKDKYKIKHFYRETGTKSFIDKNGIELNPNGNRASFLETVESELGIEPSHLDLLRLGSREIGFIDKKATERKNYAADLLKDLEVYLKLYKKINDDVRLLKSLIKSVGDKIEKLRVYSENEENEKFDKLSNQLIHLQGKRDELTSQKGSIDGTIEALVPQGLDQFVIEIQTAKRNYRDIIQEVQQLDVKKRKLSVIVLGDINETINQRKSVIQEHRNQINVNQNMLEFYFKQLEQMYSAREEKSNSLKFISSDTEYSQISQLYTQLKQDKIKLGERFEDYTPICSREDMMNALVVLQEMDKIIAGLREYNHGIVRRVSTMLLNGESVSQYVKNEVSKLDRHVSEIQQSIHTQRNSNAIEPGSFYVLYKPSDCNCVCPYQKFYNDVMGSDKKEDVMGLEKKLLNLETERESILSHLDVEKTIGYIFMALKTNQNLIERVKLDAFQVEHILRIIKDNTLLYDEDEITGYIDVLEDYDKFIGLDSKIHEVKRELQFIEMQKQTGSIETTQQDLLNLDRDIKKQEQEISRLREANDESEKIISDLESSIEILVSFKEYSDLQEEKEKEAEILNNELSRNMEIHERVRELSSSVTNLQQNLQAVDREIKETESAINDIRFRLREFKSLNEEKAILETKFDDLAIIRESLSSSKGIPLLYMELFLNDIKADVNEFLQVVYRGNLEIQNFIINEKEFRIPYTKNGLTVEDVTRCSQGERTFISVAISFALILHSIQEYNIISLDEIDATLDSSYRAVFISIVEEHMKKIGAEQIHIITHNDMFDNYPVDVIMTSDVNIDNYKNVNVIFRGYE